MMNEYSCEKAEKQITSYFAHKLNDDEKLQLINHLDTCKNCMEEFTVQHLVYTSLNDSDDLSDLDPKSELMITQKEILRQYHIKDVAERFYLGILYLGVSVFVFAALMIIL